MKTTAKELQLLKEAMESATAEYNAYNKKFKEEHNIKGRNLIREIIAMHKSGASNAEIIAAGFNKNTVREQTRLYKKGKRVAKTIVSQYLPPKDKKEKASK